MNGQSSPSAEYPGGHVRYLFDMHVDYAIDIPCSVPIDRVLEIVLTKQSPSDKTDQTWSLFMAIGPNTGINDVDTVGANAKEGILNLISLILGIAIRNVRLVCHGLIPRPGEGAIGHAILPPIQCSGTGYGTGLPLGSDRVLEIQATLNTHGNSASNTLALFRHAVSTEDPVVQFLVLYLILYELHQNQAAVDASIMAFEPTTTQSVSPHARVQETIYTRLRNQLTHGRGIPFGTTQCEVANNLDMFRGIVQRALRATL